MNLAAIGLSQLPNLRGLGRRAVAGVWPGWTCAFVEPPVQRPKPRPAARMGRDEQWSRVTSVIAGAVQRSTDAKGFHAAAEQQLDLAHYALCNLMDELSAVMAVPARRGPAVVRVLEPRPQRFIEGAWAA